MLNSKGHGFEIHGAVRIGELGLLKTAQVLVDAQKTKLTLNIHTVPTIGLVSRMDRAFSNIFNVAKGLAPETSG